MDKMVVLGTAVLLVRVGQLFYAAGLSRSKNAAAAAMRVVADLCAATLAFWAAGTAILPGAGGVSGPRWHGFFAGSAATGETFFFAAVVLVATGSVAGAVGERSKFVVAWAAPLLLAGLVVPLAGRWAWSGWLARMGFVDVAGASVVHLSAGACAAVGAFLVGPRTGKYNRDGSANMIPGHHIPFVAAGVLVMLVGWVPYVAGSAAMHGLASGDVAAPMNVLLAAAAAGAASIALGHFRYGKPDVVLTLAGVMGGLVSISAAAGSVGTISAVVIGAVAGVVVPWAAVTFDLIAHLDDPAGAVAIHAVGGLWGTLAAGLLAPVTIAERLKLTGVQALGALAIAALSGGLALALFVALKATVGIRVSEADEYDGLDLAEHDIGAYPDFQQTMIKSYHLREA